MASTAPSRCRRSRSFSHRCRGALLRCAVLATAAVVEAYDTIDGHPCFRNLRGIIESMFDLVESHPDLASVSVIGESFLRKSDSNNDEYGLPQNGYKIYAMNITSNDGPHQPSEKGKTLIISGVHAREYAPPELVMRFAETLLNGYGTDSDITWLLEHTEIHLIFHVNPDARYVAETYPETRWRKNMNPDRGRRCDPDEVGVDINRNYDFMWGEEGSSSDPCDSTYRGRSANSEPETQAVVKYARDLFPDGQRRDDPENEPLGEEIMGLFIDIHSPGGYVYYPWGFEDKTSPDDDALQALGRKLGSFNGYVLWAGGQPDFQYTVSGDSSDYMYGVLGVASFGLELGEDFYEDCGLFEDAVAPDNLPALLYAASTSKRPFSLAKGPDILSLEVADVRGGEIQVTAVASDSEMVNGLWGYPDFATGDQGVAEVKLYLDVHPDDYREGDTSWLVKPEESDSGKQTFQMKVSLARGFSSGRHTLYAQAMDGGGYVGPVSSVFFHVERRETAAPSRSPTCRPTSSPSEFPSGAPTTVKPSTSPIGTPTTSPTQAPTLSPATAKPTAPPTGDPTATPSQIPTRPPATNKPSELPSRSPTASPATAAPSQVPSRSPATNKPSQLPTGSPTASPSNAPSESPTVEPSGPPTGTPTAPPTTANPSTAPTTYSTRSNAPSFLPTFVPSSEPSMNPTNQPTRNPSNSPITPDPTFLPTNHPTPKPTCSPNLSPTSAPSAQSKLGATVPAILPSQSSGNSSQSPFLFAGVTVTSTLVLMYLV